MHDQIHDYAWACEHAGQRYSQQTHKLKHNKQMLAPTHKAHARTRAHTHTRQLTISSPACHTASVCDATAVALRFVEPALQNQVGEM